MIIKFQRTLEDLIAFNLFHYEHSPHLQRSTFVIRIIVTLLLVFLPLAAIFLIFPQSKYSTTFVVVAIIVSLIGSITFFIRYPSYRQADIIDHTKKTFYEGDNEGFLGEQKFEVSAQGLLYTGRTSEAKINWSAITKVAQNDKYIFLYTSSINAIAIPRSAFSGTKMEQEFLEIVHTYSGA